MNDQLSINGSIKDNSFNKLKSNKTVKHLEISYGNVDDDWHLIGELNQLVSLSIKDSFVDFQSFYSALAKLKNLEQITYNYYCFFNKQKNDQLKNIIINIKTFQIDFPKDDEPDFDFNNYLKETYKKKFHSIFEIKNCEKIFLNLEEVIFTNYQKFKTLVKEFDSTEKKLFEKIIYWGMESSVLKKFKKLNEISIDKEKNINLLSLGVFDIIQNKNFNNLGIELNGIKNITLDKILKDINILDISYVEDNNKLINKKNLNLDKYSKILNTSSTINSSLSINPNKLYEIQYGYNKKWKVKKNKDIINIFNDNIETIIFSDVISFIDLSSDDSARKKAEVFSKIFKNLKDLKNIIFDFNGSDLNNIESNYNYFLTIFIHNIIKMNNSINIHLLNIDTNKAIKDKNRHIIYLINFLFKLKLLSKGTINLAGLSEEKLSHLYNEYIYSEIREILVIDDLIYNYSNRFNKFDIIYSDQSILDINYAFLKYRGYDPNDIINKEIPFGECLKNSISGYTNKPANLEEALPNNLILIINKNYLKEFFKKFTGQVRTIFYKYISPLSHIGNMIKHNKDFKVKNLDKISHDDQKYEMALTTSAKNSTSGIIKSNEFNFKNSDENLFLDRIKSPEYFNELMQNDEGNLKELHELYLDGDSPHYGKYIELDKLNNFVPIKKLKALRINGLINSKKYELPVMNELRLIELDLSYNSFNKLNEFEGDDKIKIKFFKNLPNLQELTLSNLRSSYDQELLNNSGYSQYGMRWHYTGVDFSDIHEIKKLKKIHIWGLDCKDLTSIKEFPAVEELILNIFQTTKDHGPDEDKYLSPPINDKSLSFFKNSKMIKKLTLRLGDRPYMDDLFGDFLATRYVGNSEFIDYISHNIKELNLTINFDIKKQSTIQDIINKICNRFLKLEKIELSFGIAIDENSFNWESRKYREKLLEQTLDFKKIIKLKNLTQFSFHNPESAIKLKFINFHEIIKLKKLKDIRGVFESISFKDFRETRKLFKNEKYGDPNYYDFDYDYMCEEDENYKSDWTRFRHINSDDYGDDWYTLEDRFIALEKKINEKKYKKTTIIKKKS